MWLKSREKGVMREGEESIVLFVGYFRLTIVQAINERLGY